MPRGIDYSGYYEPSARNRTKSLAMSRQFTSVPPDLAKSPCQKGALYHDRRTIEEKQILAGRGLNWPGRRILVGRLFLEIQGSGKLVLMTAARPI